MTIEEAKYQIRSAIQAYRTRDEHSRLLIPVHRQRPVFLMGPPGIGKTAIMEQIAQELELPLVSYSMTHHTRQSALGLPFITEKTWQGKTFRVSEYTMSEIIAAVYEKMEATGVSEGILFLDEINCVSETLAPAMLQFLQYKVFGQHQVPEGWIVVTAGNPPEYNQSVREFDMVTWDRLKRMDVEPDPEVWRKWAVNHGVHPAVMSYLDIRKEDFYSVESTVDGKSFVTPRGWVDLGEMIRLYELHQISVTGTLVSQYLQKESVARQFTHYYDLWKKYSDDYHVTDILAGNISAQLLQRAGSAPFDERISVIALMIDALLSRIGPVMDQRKMLEMSMQSLGAIRRLCLSSHADPLEMLQQETGRQQTRLQQSEAGNMLSPQQERICWMYLDFLKSLSAGMEGLNSEKQLASMKKSFDTANKDLKKQIEIARALITHAFDFIDQAFSPDGQEALIFITELTAAETTAQFISQYGCDAYFSHSQALQFYERQVHLIQQIDEMGLERD